jgi:hypothetical protein
VVRWQSRPHRIRSARRSGSALKRTGDTLLPYVQSAAQPRTRGARNPVIFLSRESDSLAGLERASFHPAIHINSRGVAKRLYVIKRWGCPRNRPGQSAT